MNRTLKRLIHTAFIILALATIQAHINNELSDKDIKRISDKVRKVINEELNKK